MSVTAEVAVSQGFWRAARARAEAYRELSKPRIVNLVLVTAFLGYFLGGNGVHSWATAALMLIGVALSAAGAGALNQYIERDADALMDRTKNRPIPRGEISPGAALAYGALTTFGGVGLLLWKVNFLTAFLAALTTALYILLYTPLKRWSWINTIVGAIPGALPPMGGWAAATGRLDLGAWALFAILFLWQHPHFYAIAWMFRDDYRKAGFRMLPVVAPDGKSTFAQIVWTSALLIPVSLLPLWTGGSGLAYAVGAAAMGAFMLAAGLSLRRTGSFVDARRVLRASVIYLPILLGLILLDALL